MLTEERFAKILSLLEETGSVTVAQLMTALDASESTVRRDLNSLDASGQLVKVHGGAIMKTAVFHSQDAHANERKEKNREEKIQIARYAANLIQDDDFIYLDAGTTTEMMIDYIQDKHPIFVTNAITHMKKLADRGFQVYILGGEYKPVTEAIVGEEAVMALDKYNFTKGFFGTNSVSVKRGFATPEVREALVKKKAMGLCKERFVLADESKFSLMSSVTFGAFEAATIITSKLHQESYKQYSHIIEV